MYQEGSCMEMHQRLGVLLIANKKELLTEKQLLDFF